MIRVSLMLLLAAALALAGGVDSLRAAPDSSAPYHMAALGDSITRAANADMHSDHPAVSWSTGGAIRSHAAIIRRLFRPSLVATNGAVSGTRMQALAGQAAALPLTVDYVTVLMGGNDVCGPSEERMTPVADYRAQFAAGMAALSERLPDARIYVVSNPNVLGLWETMHDDPAAVAMWADNNKCPVLLTRPTSTDPEDVARRQRVQARALAYNDQLAAVCAEYIHCRYDGGVLTATPVAASSVSVLDYYHPSVAGQEALSAITFARTFQFTDTVAPVTAPSGAAGAEAYELALAATDNAGVAGIEYRLNGGPWTRYAAPLRLPLSARVTYRAVDVNGLNEQQRVASAPGRRSLFLPGVSR